MLASGEMLMGNPRVLCLDEITSGLDSATAFSIMKALRTWADKTNGTVIASLLQPTPEVFQLFERTLLLKDGQLVYLGPREQTVPFIETTGVLCPPSDDYADFIVNFLTFPMVLYERQVGEELRQSMPEEELTASGTAKKVQKVCCQCLSWDR